VTQFRSSKFPVAGIYMVVILCDIAGKRVNGSFSMNYPTLLREDGVRSGICSKDRPRGIASLTVVQLFLAPKTHEHQHEYLAHEHDHYHQHEHPEGIPITEPHIHTHEHLPISHLHAHYTDIHHLHSH